MIIREVTLLSAPHVLGGKMSFYIDETAGWRHVYQSNHSCVLKDTSDLVLAVVGLARHVNRD
jgi:hypothetical protein